MSEKEQNPAVAVAKRDRASDGVRETTLSTGHRARLVPVATSLIETVRTQVKDPPVPMWTNPDKDREEENPNDPAYIRALVEAHDRRTAAVMDALMLFGVELLDGVPKDDGWLNNLRLLERHGQLDLGDLDLDDPLDRAFAFKKFIAISSEDYTAVMELSGVTASGVAAQAEMFPGTAEGPAA